MWGLNEPDIKENIAYLELEAFKAHYKTVPF